MMWIASIDDVWLRESRSAEAVVLRQRRTRSVKLEMRNVGEQLPERGYPSRKDA